MERQLNLMTRQELIRAVGTRYRTATQGQKTEILNEFVQLTQYHRKYALQLLGQDPDQVEIKPPRISRRIYQEAAREALTLLWEASDRLCGKRLQPLLPVLVEAMEQHGHLQLDPVVREQVLTVSAATIDRLLCPVRERIQGTQQRRGVPPHSERVFQSAPLPMGTTRRPGTWKPIWSFTAGDRWRAVWCTLLC